MIRVLIVEDDKLARQGLVSVLPWAAHGMEIVAEAADGEAALRILQETPVDLVLSDYSMPGMTGIDLFRHVQAKFPGVYFALITMYESFDIVQQALRLGALDYISKLQLDKETYDQVLSHLREAIESKRLRQPPPAESGLFSPEECCYAFFGTGAAQAERLHGALLDAGRAMQEIGHGIFVAIGPEGLPLPPLEKGWVVVRVTELQNQKKETLFHLLRRYYRNNLFYNFRSLDMTFYALQTQVASIAQTSQASIKRIEERWLAFLWLYDATLFSAMLEELFQARLSFNVLFRMLVRLEDAWQRTFSAIFPTVSFSLPQAFASWEEVAQLLRGLFDAVQQNTHGNDTSQEVLRGVTEAIRIVHTELKRPLQAADVAARVNFSRSYFSTSFKRITGLSFNEFLRKERMQRAKQYLKTTDMPLYMVAEETGYPDEKYFFRVFKKETGMQPGQYRKQHRT